MIALRVNLPPGEPRSQRSYGEHAAYRLIGFASRFYAVPEVAGPVCLADEMHRSSPWLLSADSLEELRDEIDRRVAQGEAPTHVGCLAGHEIFAGGGRFFAVRSEDLANLVQEGPTSESLLVDESLSGIRRRILELEGVSLPGNVLGTSGRYGLTEIGQAVFAFPLEMHGVEYLPEADRAAAGVLCGQSLADIEHAVANLPPPREVEFAGWLPAFEQFGNCGKHPQFGHTAVAPAGYRFVESPPPSDCGNIFIRAKRRFGKTVRRIKVGAAGARLLANCFSRGIGLRESVYFLKTRDLASQLLLPRRNRLLFLTSVPFTLGQDPWVIEIEDLASLLFPFVDNGRTVDVKIEERAEFGAVQALLEMENCRGIVTHVRDTATGIAKLFKSAAISGKTVHIPMGIRLPRAWQRHGHSETVNLLFTNSWHQGSRSFYLRGGLDVLEAFAAVHRACPELRLTLRTRLPGDLPPRYHSIIEDCAVTVLDEFLPASALEELMLSSHVFLLPSARIHIMSLLQAMAYGLVPVASDGWGMTEYLDHGRTGLIVPGRYGKVAWTDEQNGMLREDYAPMYRADSQVTQHLINELSVLADEHDLRRELAENARREVETRFSLAQWNVGLKRVLDRAWRE